MRDAPSLVIVPTLLDKGAEVKAHDPQGRRHAEAMLEGVTWCDDAMTVAEGADVLVLLTEWNEYRALDLRAVRAAMSSNILVDLRNVFQAGDALAAGLFYEGIGRAVSAAEQADRTGRVADIGGLSAVA